MTEWRKSTFSNNGKCWEMVDFDDGTVGVRDSKLGDNSPVIHLSRAALADLLGQVKAGDLDHMA